MNENSDRESLMDELETVGEIYFSSGRWNNISDLSLTILTVLASLAATGLASVEREAVSRWVIAGVAAIPAAASSLQRIIGIKEKSNWYFLCATRVRALATQLQYAKSPDIEDFGKKHADLQVEMEKEWLRLGHGGSARPRQSSGRRSSTRGE